MKVFHEAIKAWDYPDAPTEMRLDPAMRFDPEWIAEHQDRLGNRWIFVDRFCSPLVINARTLEVSVYPLDGKYAAFPRREPPAAAFLSYGGQLYVAGSAGAFRVFEMDPTTRRFTQTERREYAGAWHHGGGTDGSLVLDDGHLLYAGGERWLRRNLKTGHEEIMISHARSLPGTAFPWRLAVSRCFGLIAWHDRTLYQVSFD